MKNVVTIIALLIAVISGLGFWLAGCISQQAVQRASAEMLRDPLRQRFDPIHFPPAIQSASDEQCLACHRHVLEDKPRVASPSGLPASARRAPYQSLSTYQGDQDTFHRRHLVTALARDLMDLHCNTCHQGHDPRDEAPGSSATAIPAPDVAFTLRKQVDVEATCLKCHGRMNVQIMGLPGPWHEVAGLFGNSCMTCHAAIRTERHRVNYLRADAIERAGTQNADVCFGCHGGRAWYRLSYPYPRHPWPGMPSDLPDWAKARPTASEARFQIPKPQ